MTTPSPDQPAAESPTPATPPVFTWQPPQTPVAPHPYPDHAGAGYDGWYRAQWEGSAWDPWRPASAPAPHRGRVAIAAVALLAGVAVAVSGVVVASRQIHLRSSDSSASPGTTANAVTTAPGGGSATLAPLPTTPPNSSGGQSGGALDPATVAARVDPAIVDITTQIGSQGTAAGTGMILTSSGEVLTNNHVVEGATKIKVQVTGTGRTYAATVIGVDPTDDVALVQITGASGLPTVPLGDSSSVAIGDSIVALGNALGRGGAPAVTPGVVTALGQTITASDNGGSNSETLNGMIEVRAGIQPGDSGGPMADSSGRVIGMTTAGSARARRSGTLGFAIPINTALDIARQIQSGTGANVQPGERGILGVQVDDTTTGGAGVVKVEVGSPAESAGITSGDLITGVDSATIASGTALGDALKGRRPGDQVTVRWSDQSGRTHTAHIALAVGPPA